VKFIDRIIALRVKSQKSPSEFQAVKTEVEHTIFAIAAISFKLTFNFLNF